MMTFKVRMLGNKFSFRPHFPIMNMLVFTRIIQPTLPTLAGADKIEKEI